MKRIEEKRLWIFLGVVALALLWQAEATAAIPGVTGTSPSPVFYLVAKADSIDTSDGDSFLMWGYTQDIGGGTIMQYPGPTLIVNQGDTVTIRLRNMLPNPLPGMPPPGVNNVSLIVTGHNVTAAGAVGTPVAGLLTPEVPPDGTTVVAYTFVATNPGTYLYFSGTRPDIQVDMGLVGALIVRPTGFNPASPQAYEHPDTAYDREFLYLLTEMDPQLHRYVELNQWLRVDTTAYNDTNWFVNGRNFPDNLAEDFVPWLNTQPYKCVPRLHPHDRALIRYVGAGVKQHPMHYHGNNFAVIAIDGRVLESAPGNGPDLQWRANTIRSLPGQTADFIWTWNAEGLGWDIYGHLPGDPPVPGEYLPDHGKPFPVIIPPKDALTFGPFYSGTPFLGGEGELPQGHPGLNAAGGYFFMWHSHKEKELTSNDIWPGGMVTFAIVEHPDVPIIE